MRIVQVNKFDNLGGAAKVAWLLHRRYRERGYGAWLVVDAKVSDDPYTVLMSNEQAQTRWAQLCKSISVRLRACDGQFLGARWTGRIVGWLAEPKRILGYAAGIEDFDFPGSRHLLTLTSKPPDLIHCHNLHGGYFDLRLLPKISRQCPVVMTLHDAWLLSGHCAHSFACERWRTGCGKCPDISGYPAIRRDASAYNWRRKRRIYNRGRFYLATPCRWLMDKVKDSMIAPFLVDYRVIPYGIDLTVFKPAIKESARERLDLPQKAKVVLCSSIDVRDNIWKDYATMRAAIDRVAAKVSKQPLLFIALGQDLPGERIGDRAEVRFVPYQSNPETVAAYYQAADVYVHAARADTFPNTVLEALACGTPVVATAVGGIPEQVHDGVTGFVTPAGDPERMACGIQQLLEDNQLQQRFSAHAADAARHRFSVERMVDDYLAWYAEILENWQPHTSGVWGAGS